MDSRQFCGSLKGVFGFPVTPFHRDLSLDLDALAQNVDAMAAHPLCALVAAGGMGEIFSLTPGEIEQVVRVTAQAARRRMPVIAGTAFNAAIGADIARRAERAGADAILALPPAYANAPDPGLALYYEEIGRATALPLILYSREWAIFTPDQVSRLCDRIPTLGGWKDGQADLRPLHRLMHSLGDRLAWYGGAGDDYVAEYRALGAQGYTSSISNLAPKLSFSLWEAADAPALLRRFVYPLWAIRGRMRGYEVAVTKTAMELLGMTAGPVRPPLANMRPEDAADLRELTELYREVV
jgi:5-dehydro-4-deoxyglucarate dehydratase